MITKEDLIHVQTYIKIIRHAVGADNKTAPGYRNRFCADNGGSDYLRLKEMVEFGLAREGHTINDNKAQYFYITRAGCEFINLPSATIERAMDQ